MGPNRRVTASIGAGSCFGLTLFLTGSDFYTPQPFLAPCGTLREAAVNSRRQTILRLTVLLSGCFSLSAWAQPDSQWRSPNADGPPRRLQSPIPGIDRSSVVQTGKLPNEAGQVWREYDIRSFTRRSSDQDKPEQEIVDWILRETGTNIWFGEPLGLLNASANTISVYHTPSVQEVVADVVDRFISRRSEANEVGVRLVTVESPDWRIKALPYLRSVKTQTPGVEAWLISRENAALMLHDLSRRPDYREHNSPNYTIFSGQTRTIRNTQPRTFNRGYQLDSSGFGLGSNLGQIDEGFTLQISPLVARDGRTIDAVMKCSVDQIEGFTPLWIEAGTFGANQRSQIQIPQISSWRIHERFRWPTDEVLLVSRGLVPTPGPVSNLSGSISRIFSGHPPRANALLFLESREEIQSAVRPARVASRANAGNYRGRY